eukprot:Rmarinus@m.8665
MRHSQASRMRKTPSPKATSSGKEETAIRTNSLEIHSVLLHFVCFCLVARGGGHRVCGILRRTRCGKLLLRERRVKKEREKKAKREGFPKKKKKKNVRNLKCCCEILFGLPSYSFLSFLFLSLSLSFLLLLLYCYFIIVIVIVILICSINTVSLSA